MVDELANTYGGVYTWVDREAMETYLSSDIYKAVAAKPNLTNVASRDFEVLEGPTRVTRALLTAAA